MVHKLLLLVLFAVADADLFSSRHTRANPCSLVGSTEPSDICSMKSVFNSTSDNTLRVMFGVRLTNCRKGTCFFIYDLTSRIPTDEVSRPLPTSFFYSIVVNGADFRWRKRGINFTPTQSEVEFIYSTQTCHDFYRIRGSETEQNCNYPMEAISTIEAVNCILE